MKLLTLFSQVLGLAVIPAVFAEDVVSPSADEVTVEEAPAKQNSDAAPEEQDDEQELAELIESLDQEEIN